MPATRKKQQTLQTLDKSVPMATISVTLRPYIQPIKQYKEDGYFATTTKHHHLTTNTNTITITTDQTNTIKNTTTSTKKRTQLIITDTDTTTTAIASNITGKNQQTSNTAIQNSIKDHHTLYIQIPSRPTDCTLHALVSRLWGGWTALAVLKPPDTRTANEKRYNVVKTITHDNGDIKYGHACVIQTFLPSFSELRIYAGGKIVMQVRAALCFDTTRRESKIQLKHGQLLQLWYLKPEEMLEARKKELQDVAKAQEIARKSGRVRKKVKVIKTTNNNTTSRSTSSTKKTKGNKKKLTEKQLRILAKKEAARNKKMEEEENEEDEDLLLLQSMQTPGLFYCTIQWMVGGHELKLGPISERHIVADVCVYLERITKIPIRKMRMNFQGKLIHSLSINFVGFDLFYSFVLSIKTSNIKTATRSQQDGETNYFFYFRYSIKIVYASRRYWFVSK